MQDSLSLFYTYALSLSHALSCLLCACRTLSLSFTHTHSLSHPLTRSHSFSISPLSLSHSAHVALSISLSFALLHIRTLSLTHWLASCLLTHFSNAMSSKKNFPIQRHTHSYAFYSKNIFGIKSVAISFHIMGQIFAAWLEGFGFESIKTKG